MAGRTSATARDLIRMIHRINPTKAGVEAQKAAYRYRLKARLQSLLIRRFGEGLIVEQPNVNQPQLIGIRLRNFDEDACHALPAGEGGRESTPRGFRSRLRAQR